MPDHLKKYIIAARVKEPSDWYKITTQLKLSTNKEEPQQPSTSTSTPVKRLNSKSSKAHQYQPFPRTAAATHHQQEPYKSINQPPYPCKICASHHLPNQIHFHRDCPLKNNNHPKRINAGDDFPFHKSDYQFQARSSSICSVTNARLTNQGRMSRRPVTETKKDNVTWGWMVTFAGFLIAIIFQGVLKAQGVFYLDFVEVFQVSKEEASWPGSVISCLMCLLGLKIEYTGGKNQHFRHLLFFALHRGQQTAETVQSICNMYGEGVIGERAAQKWFAKFKNGDLDLEYTPRSGRPIEFDEKHLKALLKEDGRQTTFRTSWPKNKLNTQSTRSSHSPSRQRHDMRHVAQVVKAAFQELEWEVLQHPPYSTDIAPTDYHLFRSMSNHMRGTTFDDEEGLKSWLNNFFDTSPGDFWPNGIKKLVKTLGEGRK
ncbi:hypothetical protein LAZ67_3002631 [Cordylochernes scorpioides]|uniref:Mos1 transposase HTH domain-containing protein n=1 Tax=Cordylochernes scorpioides TaxID=51811 RepID=A0ABY6K818_9ARAC|nr:hypothetical protein LAZ67_3002631 [Cordylochernes scorpioides]